MKCETVVYVFCVFGLIFLVLLCVVRFTLLSWPGHSRKRGFNLNEFFLIK